MRSKLRRMVIQTFDDGRVRIIDETAPNQWGADYIVPERPKGAISNNPGYFEWLLEEGWLGWRFIHAMLILSAFVTSIIAIIFG